MVRLRSVTRSLGRRAFKLSGNRWHVYKVGLTKGGRALLRKHGALRGQLVAAIPGGRRSTAVSIRTARR